ncbi:elongation factor 1-beta isoform X1 [Diaphorina citri]|uniref:Elongation factor 1-beta n=1 Tax=Diaphorina citri TaxID=121845 RepID=Q0PXV3_DIACI|nr:elongation factor 1-beta [Diaphorina citri]XP_026683768.1 elongation factor 1-beta isoform X1 [Diaphorina citri]ABG82006.1 putative elongation factor 1 beta' [Diaphorina citri]
MVAIDVSNDKGLKEFNEYISSRSYVEGFQPSQADVAAFEQFAKPPPSNLAYVSRWYNHIKSFSKAEQSKFPGVKPSGSVPAKKEEEDDDDVDLFGSDDEEDEEAAKIREARLKAYSDKKSKKPALIAKSSILLDVKPWDDETDMKELEASVRTIEMDGLLWGASKLQPVGYGINKLTIMCVIEDDKVSVDELQEKITEFEDFVQSVDIAAFNKI